MTTIWRMAEEGDVTYASCIGTHHLPVLSMVEGRYREDAFLKHVGDRNDGYWVIEGE